MRACKSSFACHLSLSNVSAHGRRGGDVPCGAVLAALFVSGRANTISNESSMKPLVFVGSGRNPYIRADSTIRHDCLLDRAGTQAIDHRSSQGQRILRAMTVFLPSAGKSSYAVCTSIIPPPTAKAIRSATATVICCFIFLLANVTSVGFERSENTHQTLVGAPP